MSMSTLGNQLAALSSSKSSSNNNAGIVNSTSRTNNDGIGRGFHHSNKVGYSTLMNGGGGGIGDGVKRRPSILYDNARDAAEVSLVTLHENAISSLSHLSSSSHEASTTTLQRQQQQQLWNDAQFINTQNGLLSLHNLNNFERGTSTLQENELVDASIVQLLKLLMTMVTECIPPSSTRSDDINNINSNNPILLSCLHIIEYLLRKYEIHTRPLTSSMLLQTILPLQIIYPSSYYTQLFKRVISLMDLTLLPTWTFLRPYVAQGAPSVNRNMLSKFVAKDDSLALCIANIGKYGMEICIKECNELRMDEEDDNDMMMMQIDQYGEGGVMDNDNSKARTNSTGALIVRRGISSLISFSASTLVEAIHIQSSSKDAGIGGGGGVQESLVRVLYPLVLSACKSGGCGSSSGGDGLYYYCPEWKEWGRILTSTISILCPLKHDAKIGLCDAIVDGLPLVELGLHGGGTKGKKTKTKTKKKNSFQEAVQDVATVKASSLPTAIKDDASSAIMTLLSVLGTMTNVNDGDDDDDSESLEYYLPILPPKKKKQRRRITTTTIIDYMGCELPPSTYKRLSKEYGASMAMYLGSVLQILRGEDGHEDDDNEEEEDDNPIILERMAPLVASIIMHAFSRLEKEAGKVLSSTSPKKRKSKSKGGEEEKDVMKCKADRDVILILTLVSCFLLFSALRSCVKLWPFICLHFPLAIPLCLVF